jgi:hypothetical protein
MLQRVYATLATVAAFACSAHADAPLPDRDFAEYLLARELVVEATLLSADKVDRTLLGGCFAFPKMKSRDLRLRIRRVIFGTAEDTTIVISTLGQPTFPPALLVSGARVIAWADRLCSDGWRPHGNMVIITDGGELVGHYNVEGLFLHDGPEDQPVTYTALNAKLAMLAARHSTKYFDEKAAVGLVRVRAFHRKGPGAFAYECDSLRWVMGEAERLPRFVDVDSGNLNCGVAQVGDSLLVPVAAGGPGDRVALPGCSGAMVVKHGFCTGFGVPLPLLSRALSATPTGLQVRPFLGNER